MNENHAKELLKTIIKLFKIICDSDSNVHLTMRVYQ